MELKHKIIKHRSVIAILAAYLLAGQVAAQQIDRTLAPNPANAGIAKSFAQQIGAGRGDAQTPESSLYIINRAPFRSIRRGRCS